jgi:hypothetical protein
MTKLTPHDIKMIFIECDNKDPNGLYADEVDLYEFADKLQQVIEWRQEQAAKEQS